MRKADSGDGEVNEDRAASGTGFEVSCLDERRAESVRWLWEGRIPAGKVSLVVGDPDVGKSFVTLDLAARVTRGEGVAPEAGPGRPRGALLLCADDDVDDTVLPRLSACGAELSRVVWFSSFVEEASQRGATEGDSTSASPHAVERRMVSLARDVGRLEAAARRMGDCGLIVIDPVSAYLQGVDANSNVDVRRVLWRLGEMARTTGAAVVLVSHHRKAGAATAVHRTIGSLAFTAAARVVMAVVGDPAVRGRRLLLPVKMNLQPTSSGRAFRIEDGRVSWEEDRVPLTAEELHELAASGLATIDRRGEAAEWLRGVLKDGPRPAEELHRMACAEEIPRKILWDAKTMVGARVVRDGRAGRWRWELPPKREPAWMLSDEELLKSSGVES